MRPTAFIKKFISDLFNIAASQRLADGTVEWRRRGALHREDGPAVIRPDGTENYYLEGRKLSLIDVVVRMPIQFRKEKSSWRGEWQKFKRASEEWKRS